MLKFLPTATVPAPRMLAQVQAKVRLAGLPTELAPVLAARMESAASVDDKDFQDLLTALSNMAKSFKTSSQDLVACLEEAMGGDTGEDEEPETGGEDDPAEVQPEASASKSHILSRVVKLAAAKRPHTKPAIGRTNAEYFAPRGTRPNMTAVSALASQIAGGGRMAQDDDRAVRLSDIAMQCARAAGHRPRTLAEGVRMAMHSTSDFPQILEGALGNAVARRMEQVTPGLLRASHLIQAETYHQRSLLGLSASGMPQEIGETGEIRHVTIDETGELKPTPRDFGSMFTISQKAIVNDDLGLFQQVANQMVTGSTERLRRVLLEPLLANAGLGNTMSDGLPVFHASHKNLAGTASALSVTSLSEARVALRSQTGKQGELYGYEPWALVVPAQLETTAQQIVAEITAATVSEVNPFSGKLEVIVEAGLTDPKAWYLIADPAKHDGHAHSFLEGRNAPSVETREGWNNLGLEFRLVWALDARFVSYSSWFKNPGA
jgi:hypothetical protein